MTCILSAVPLESRPNNAVFTKWYVGEDIFKELASDMDPDRSFSARLYINSSFGFCGFSDYYAQLLSSGNHLLNV
jgi:hypothetical protein